MKNKAFNPLLNETFLIRPNADYKGMIVRPDGYEHPNEILRYAGGKWIPDDGEPDLAFIHGVFYYGVNIPNSTNILWEWSDADLTESFLPKYLHKVAKSWHYYTLDDTPFGDEAYQWDNSNHPNKIAVESASNLVCKLHGCANGVLANILSEGKYKDDIKCIRDKLILIQSTMKPLTMPENPTCYLCKDNGKGHLFQALESYKEDLEYRLEENQESINKAESTIADCEYENEKCQEELKEVNEELNKLMDREN